MYLHCNNLSTSLMNAKIVQIGNSKGLRLSKTLIEKYEIKDKVELVLLDDGILLKPIANPREGWDEQFKAMSEQQDDQLLIDDVFSDEDLEEWK